MAYHFKTKNRLLYEQYVLRISRH